MYLCRIHQERHICTDAERAVQMCISVQIHQERLHLYRHRKNCTNVYLGRIHQERHLSTGAERAVQIYDRIHQERNICRGAGRAVQMCISIRIHQEKHICIDEEKPV